MSAESIVSLNVGGTIFQTSPSTMLKYPDSKLARMYNEGQKIKNLNFFLDEDPEYFRIVLNFLRKGKVIQFEDEDKNLFDGVCDLAKNLEVADLVKLLETRDYCLSTVVLEIGNKFGCSCHDCNSHNFSCKEIAIARKFLTRVPESHLAKFFFGEQGSQNPLSAWIFRKGPNRYSISNRTPGLTEHILKFMEMPTNSEFHTSAYYGGMRDFIGFLKELKFYGIQEFDHFKKSPGNTYAISWNENYNVN